VLAKAVLRCGGRGEADLAEEVDVLVAVGVGVARLKVDALLRGEDADGVRLARPPQGRAVCPAGQDAVVAGLEGGAQHVVDAERAGCGLELEAGCRGSEHQGVAHAVVGLHELPGLGVDPRRQLLREHPFTDGRDVVLVVAVESTEADGDELLEVLLRLHALEGQPGRADRLEWPDLPAAEPVDVEVDGREAVDQRAVEVEECPDLRALGPGVHLGKALRQQHR
jgi:hypothetical protein